MNKNKSQNLQTHFFYILKEKLPTNFSLVEEVSTLLNISNDSAYRRIRGDKLLTIDELYILSNTHRVSMDTLWQVNNDSVVFKNEKIDKTNFDFNDYIGSVLTDIRKTAKYENTNIICTAKDIPFFYYFFFPELAAFKTFFWHKTVLHIPDFQDENFSQEIVENTNLKIGKEILDIYLKLPSIEIWGEEIINGTIRQICFYKEAGFFDSDEMPNLLLAQLKQVLKHIEKQASSGEKFFIDKASCLRNNYQLFFNEVVVSDNTILVNMGQNKIVYLMHNELNYMKTRNTNFGNQVFDTAQIFMKKSMLLSSASEKERKKYFNKLYDKIDNLFQK